MTTLVRGACCTALLALSVAVPLRAQSSSIRVTIAGGPHAGTYELKDLCEVKANAFPMIHIMGWAAFGGKPDSPRSMEFFSASAPGKPDGFVVSVVFATPEGQVKYEIYAMPKDLWPAGQALPMSGSGTVSVKAAAVGKTATFRGTTKDGVKMEGTIVCTNDGAT